MSSSATTPGRPDVVVVGGGLAGLAAATVAARAGAAVTLFEARDTLGGRARTDHVEGFAINQGPHALYKAGAGLAVLKGLGVEPKGQVPSQRGARGLHDGVATPLARLSAVGGFGGLRTARRMTSQRVARRADGQSMAAWLDENVSEKARPFAEMIVRTTSYGVDLAHQDAGATLDQIRRGSRNVLYLDGGWSTLVDGLMKAAHDAGVVISNERVTAVEADHAGVALTLGSGSVRDAGSVVLAVGGATHADKLLGGASARVAHWAHDAAPIRAACLDVALRNRPGARPVIAYGLGEPTYVIDHRLSAAVGPEGTSLIHCLWYEPDLAPDVDHRAALESRLDLLRPEWREDLVEARFSRRFVVAHDRPRPGQADRDTPTVVVGDVPRVFVAGDWITEDGWLADGALSSGQAAGREAALAGRRAAVTA